MAGTVEMGVSQNGGTLLEDTPMRNIIFWGLNGVPYRWKLPNVDIEIATLLHILLTNASRHQVLMF